MADFGCRGWDASLATIFSRRVHPTGGQRHAALLVNEVQGKVVKAMAIILLREQVSEASFANCPHKGAMLPKTAPFLG
jgi:hypothetical protein